MGFDTTSVTPLTDAERARVEVLANWRDMDWAEGLAAQRVSYEGRDAVVIYVVIKDEDDVDLRPLAILIDDVSIGEIDLPVGAVRTDGDNEVGFEAADRLGMKFTRDDEEANLVAKLIREAFKKENGAKKV